MRYPTLPVDLLDDGLIDCGDYPDWASACWVIKSHPEDRKILRELLASIPEEGVLEPLSVAIRSRDLHPYLTDGHHRAVALMELGIKEFPYQWIGGPTASLPVHILENLEALRA